MQRLRNLPHLSKPTLGPLTLAVLSLTLAGGGGLKSARADYVPSGTQISMAECKAHKGYLLINGQNTQTSPQNLNPYDYPPSQDYEWVWNGTGTGPNRTFKQEATLTISDLQVSAGAGVHATARRRVKLSLRNPNDNTEISGLEEAPPTLEVTGPANLTKTAGDTGTGTVVAILQPAQATYPYYNSRIKIRVSALVESVATLPANGTSGLADAGLQKITPTTFTLQP